MSGRPASFAGAVGRGFSLEVSANRSVVRLGDPISLTITIHGDGNLESVSLPPLGLQESLPDQLFQVPAEQATGILDGNQKQFHVNVRVKNPSVTQIPALAFSWFDPYQERFVTTTSKPIALQVMETQVISAADVVSSGKNSESPGANGSNQATSVSGSDPGSSAISFVGANLAIVQDPLQLLAQRSSLATGKTIVAACYLLALAIVAVCVVGRRRATMDKAAATKKKRLKALWMQVETAPQLPAKEAAEQLARALRDLLAEFSPPDRSSIDRLVARCDNIIYATGAVSDVGISEIVSESKLVLREVTGE